MKEGALFLSLTRVKSFRVASYPFRLEMSVRLRSLTFIETLPYSKIYETRTNLKANVATANTVQSAVARVLGLTP